MKNSAGLLQIGEIHSYQSDQSVYLDPDKEILRYDRSIPHWFQPEKLQFITFRLADSLPAQTRKEISSQIKIFNDLHPKPWDEETQLTYDKKFSERIMALLDKGYGECILRDPQIRKILIQSLLYCEDREDLFITDLVLMPNHVHMLAVFNHPHEGVMNNLMRYVARKINTCLNRKGNLWKYPFFDRMIRNETHLLNVRAYIAKNPRYLPTGDYYYFSRPIPSDWLQ